MQKTKILLTIIIFSLFTLSCIQFNSVKHQSILVTNPKASTGSPPVTTISYKPSCTIPNPNYVSYGFENSFEGWIYRSGGYVSLTTEEAHGGNYSVKITAVANVNAYIWKTFSSITSCSFWAMAEHGTTGWFDLLTAGSSPPTSEVAKTILFMYHGNVILGDLNNVDSPTLGTILTHYVDGIWYKFSFVDNGSNHVLIYMNDYLLLDYTAWKGSFADSLSLENLYQSAAMYFDDISICSGSYNAPKLFVESSTLFTLSATDPDNDLDSTYYQIDGNGFITYSVPFDLRGYPTNGTHEIDYYSVDLQNNVETTKTEFVNLDSNSPVSTISRSSNFVSNTTIFTINDVDGTGESGKGKTYYTFGGGVILPYFGPFQITGIHGTPYTITFWSIDRNGNNETTGTPMSFIYYGHCINIQRDSDWPTYAHSGDGSPGNPWVLDGFSIDGQFTFTPLTIINTKDHVIIENCQFANGTVSGGGNVLIYECENIVLENVAILSGDSDGFIMANCKDIQVIDSKVNGSAQCNLYCEGLTNCTFMHDVFSYAGANNVMLGKFLSNNASENVVLDKCQFIEFHDKSQLYVEGTSSLLVENSEFDSGNQIFYQNDVDLVTIKNCTLNCNFSQYCITDYADDVLIEENTFNNPNWIKEAINVHVGASNTTISGNYIDSYSIAVDCGYDGDVSVTGNYFRNITKYCLNNSNLNSWDGNYYFNYFNVYPSDTTINNSSNILAHSWNCGYGMKDYHPRYYQVWYPRSDTFTWAIYSSIDGLGIDMDWFKVLANNYPVYDHTIIAQHVLYTIVIMDFANRTYFDNVFNINMTKHVYITIPITTLNLENNGSSDVYITLTRLGKSTIFIVSSHDEYSLRVIIGTFTYTVRYQNGSIVYDRGGVALMNLTKNVTGPSSIIVDFGPIQTRIVNNVLSNPYLELFYSFGGLGLIFGAIYSATKFIELVYKSKRPTHPRTLGGRPH